LIGAASTFRITVWCAAACAAVAAGTLIGSQTADVSTAGGMIRVTTSAFTFIEGATSARLRDGQSVPIDLELTILDKSEGTPLASKTDRCVLSYDLWEERFAATRRGPPTRSLSHLTARRAEAWCLEGLAVPVTELVGLKRDAPFWLTLIVRVQAVTSRTDARGETTIGRLVDLLSRRRDVEPTERVLRAGPFRVSN
jgi:hypothetical protein